MDITEITILGIVSFIGYVIVGIRLMKLCEASSVGSGWFAFVPILNFTRWARLAGKNPWLVLLFFIPIVGYIIVVVLELLWLNAISEKTGTKSPWFWVFLIFTLGGGGAISIFSGVIAYIALIIFAVLLIAAQWMIFDPTKPISGVADQN